MTGGGTIAERLARYSMPEPNTGCILWFGAALKAGYGRIRTSNGVRLAHRVAYEIARGPIPDDLVIDHRCNTPACINPAHMKAATQRDNTLRSDTAPTAINARKTHCIRGHELLSPRHDGTRRCRICDNEMQRRRYRARAGGTIRAYQRKDAAGIRADVTSEQIDERGQE